MVQENNDKILILGIGNLLWADEGFGIRAIEAFNAKYKFADNVTIMDGGTQGLYLIPFVQECDVLVIFDAIDYGLVAGEIKIIKNEDVPSFMGAKKMSLHQTGFQEVLATSQFMGWKPKSIILIGVQPQEIEDYGGSLRSIVEAQIEPVIDIAINELALLGIKPISCESGDELGPSAIAKDIYEKGRPSEDEAYRHGDYRFIAMLEEE